MRYVERRSLKASWSLRIALIAALAFAGTLIWHRFFGLPTPTALKTFYAAVILAVTGLTVAAAALVDIWNEGTSGTGKASLAVILSLLLLAVPAVSLPNLLRLPRIYEVTTDPSSPRPSTGLQKSGKGRPIRFITIPALGRCKRQPIQTSSRSSWRGRSTTSTPLSGKPLRS